MELTGPVQAFLSNEPVKEWHIEVARKRVSTANLYAQSLFSYWSKSILPRGFSAISQWVEEVQQQQRSEDVKVRRRWATDLQNWLYSYKGVRTGRTLTTKTRNIFIAAVKSFLQFQLGEVAPYKFVLGTSEEIREEEMRADQVAPLSIDELRKLYSECRSKRDRAIFLTLVCGGMGVSEFLQFSHDWSKYKAQIMTKSVPVKVYLKRKKTGVSYYSFLWDDCVNALAGLIEERERTLGRPLKNTEPLFVNQEGQPISDQVLFQLIRTLAERSGVEPRDSNKVSYRVRVHEVARDTFRTLCQIQRVPTDVAEYLLGHTFDKLGYAKLHKTPEGQRIIQEEASKLRSLVNIVTSKGAEHPSTDLDEVADMVTISLKINDKEACRKLFNVLCRKHPDLYKEAYERLPSTGEAKFADAEYQEIERYPILRALTRKELVMLGVEVAMEGSSKSNGNTYEVKKIVATDEDAYALAVAEGFEEKGRINGTIIMRRGNN